VRFCFSVTVLPPILEIRLSWWLLAKIHFIVVWFGLNYHCCLWQETLFGSLPVLSALPSEEEDLRSLDRSGNVALVVKVRFAGDASE